MYIASLHTSLCIQLTVHMLCCAALGSNWREVDTALDRLVSQERELAIGDSQKGIHNGGQMVSVYMFQRLHGMCDSWDGERSGHLYTHGSIHTKRGMMEIVFSIVHVLA